MVIHKHWIPLNILVFTKQVQRTKTQIISKEEKVVWEGIQNWEEVLAFLRIFFKHLERYMYSCIICINKSLIFEIELFITIHYFIKYWLVI